MEKRLESCYGKVKVPEATSLSQFVMERVSGHGHKVALIEEVTGRSMTYQDLMTSYRYVRCGLYKRGVVKDDVILLLLPSCLEYPIIFHAILSLGGIISSCTTSATTEEVARQMTGSGACHVFTVPEYVNKIREAVPADHDMKCCFVVGQAEGCISYDDLLKDDASEYPVTILNVREDLALLPYSSGTTGCPKPVKLTHYSLVHHMCQLLHPDLAFMVKEDLLLSVLSMSHAFVTIVFLNMALMVGCTTVIVPTRDMDAYIDALHKYRPTMLHLIPPALDHMVKLKLPASSFTSVHTVTNTASPLNPDLAQQIQALLRPGAKIRQIFGMTECGILMMCPQHGSPPGSVGCLIPNVSARVIHQEDGHDCGPGELGELLVQGAQSMSGYLNLPYMTNTTITEDGWVHTGDLVRFDEEQYFYFMDRIKDIIRYEGLQVSPAELECMLRSHPGVRDVAVVGIPTDIVGEVPKAFVVREAGYEVTGPDLELYIEDIVAPSKRLRGGVEFIDSIPTLSSGKILRHQLRQREIEKRGADGRLEKREEETFNIKPSTERWGEEGETVPIHTPPPTKRSRQI